MKSFFLFLILFMMLNSCFLSKTVRLAKRGKVNMTNEVHQIPFEMHKDLIILKVIINDKDYRFLFDTGAFMSVIDPKILDEINFKNISKHVVTSSSGASNKADYIEIPSIIIDSLNFTNTGALIQDLSGINSMLGCNSVDGIIGNSLLKLLTWQIDYENRILFVAKDVSFLKTSSIPVDVSNKKWGVKRISIEIDGDKRSYTFDTGFNNFIQSNSYLKENLIELNDSINAVSLTGELSADLFGKNKSETFYVKTKSIKFANESIQNQIVFIKENGSSLIGNKCLKNYLITYDWKNSQIYFYRVKPFENDSLFAFNEFFIPDYDQCKFVIVAKWQNDGLPIKVHDIIDEIDGENVADFSKSELCNYWELKSKELKTRDELRVKINGEVYLLKKKLLLN